VVSSSVKAGALAQMAVAGERNALRRAFLKLLDARLGPQVRALREDGEFRG
jgi:hypothetical protein